MPNETSSLTVGYSMLTFAQQNRDDTELARDWEREQKKLATKLTNVFREYNTAAEKDEIKLATAKLVLTAVQYAEPAIDKVSDIAFEKSIKHLPDEPAQWVDEAGEPLKEGLEDLGDPPTREDARNLRLYRRENMERLDPKAHERKEIREKIQSYVQDGGNAAVGLLDKNIEKRREMIADMKESYDKMVESKEDSLELYDELLDRDIELNGALQETGPLVIKLKV